MRLSLQLGLALVVAAVAPVLVAGWLVGSHTTRSLEARVQASQLASAESLAAASDRWLGDLIGRLDLSVDLFDLEDMSPAARTGALRLLYRQLDELDAVALLDAEGSPVVPLVFLPEGAAVAPHLPLSGEDVASFQAAVPRAAALEAGAAVGDAYLLPDKHAVVLPVAVRVPAAGGDWVLAAAVALRPVQEQVASASGGGAGTAYLVDDRGRILAHPVGARFLEEGPVTAGGAAGGGVRRVESPEGTLLAAVAPLSVQPWSVVVAQPVEAALAPVSSLRGRMGAVLGFAAVLAGLTGIGMAAGIGRPLRRAAASARAIARGEFDVRLAPSRTPEVRDLASAFEVMSTEVARSRSEIEAMNRSLQQQVEERTRALRQAQAELMESRKLAAVGELGAGVAHELNNPLTGILGLTQLLLRRHPEGDPTHASLRRIEADARRCRDVTANLLRFSEQGEIPTLTPTSLNGVVTQAVGLKRTLVETSGLTLSVELADDLPEVLGDPAQLQEVLLHLLANAHAATPVGGAITLETGWDGEFVWVRVSDTGRGIAAENLERIFEPFFTTKDDWAGAGLGLSVSYRIVEAHHGTLRVENGPLGGARFTVALPRAPGREAA